MTAAACGGDDDDGADADAGGDGNGGEDPCGFASDRYLPYEVGFHWTYKITDLTSGAVATKDQSIDDEIEDGTFGTVRVQLTGKLNGTTRSLVKVDGERLLRMQQEDLDAADALERTTVYDPGQLRMDETAEHTAADAAWDDSYDNTETEVGGGGPVTVAVVDHWEVLDVAAECESPFGTFECIRLKKTRTAGGTSVKEFYFAKGIGKVRESGDSQLEELTACGK